MSSAASTILDFYRQYLTENIERIGTKDFPLPFFPKEMILEILQKSIAFLEQDGNVVNINGNVHVLGDLHGNIFDLVRLLAHIGKNFESPVVFLGDYVDRGQFSTEVTTLLFSLKVLYPSTIVLIRGNHEFRDVNINYGFKSEVCSIYDEETWQAFNNAFDRLPFAAIINNSYFCVHGGISPHLHTINNIVSLTNPVSDYQSSNNMPLLKDILWSDPSPLPLTFTPSNRGIGCIYGMNAVQTFLERNKLKGIIRGHQYIFTGILNMHNLVYTVFSSSSYLAKAVPNQAGLLCVHEDCSITFEQFNPMKIPQRADCIFKTINPSREVSHESIRSIKLLKLSPILMKPNLSSISGKSSRIKNYTPQPIISAKFRTVVSHSNLPKIIP